MSMRRFLHPWLKGPAEGETPPDVDDVVDDPRQQILEAQIRAIREQELAEHEERRKQRQTLQDERFEDRSRWRLTEEQLEEMRRRMRELEKGIPRLRRVEPNRVPTHCWKPPRRKRFASREAAEQHLAEHPRATLREPYECRFCGGWHLGLRRYSRA